METLKKIINIVVMVYLVVAVLIYLKILNIGQDTNPSFYPTFFIIGGIIMLLELLIENGYIMALKRSHVHTQHKINELKATLYDQKQELQDIKNKQAETTVIRPEVINQSEKPGAGVYTNTTTNTVVADASAAAPVGTPATPVAAATAEDNPFAEEIKTSDRVIITPSPTAGITDPERRLPENSDS